MRKAPTKKRTSGAEPLRAWNPRAASAASVAPRTKPGSSGRR